MYKKRLLLVLIVVSVLAYGTFVFGADNVLPLRDALQLALERNGTLHSSQLDVEKANIDLNVTYRNLLPQINVQSTYTRLDSGVPTPTGEYIAFPTGQTIELPVMGNTISIPVMASAPKMEEGSPDMFNTQISIQQPVFVGGKALLGIDLAKKGVKLAEIQADQKTSDILYGVIQAYYNLLMAEEMLKIQQDSLALLKEHLRIAQVNLEAGLVLESDLLQIEIEERKAMQSVKSAENRIYLAKRQLAGLVGLSNADFAVIEPDMQLESFFDIESSNEWLYAKALRSRSELQSLEMNQEMLDTNLTMTKRYFWPNVVLMGNYSWKGSELSFADGSWNVSLAMSMQAFDGGISAKKVDGFKIQIQQLTQAKEDLTQMVELEVEEALLMVDEARQAKLLQQLSKQSAKENLRLANERYKAGVGTNLDVLNAQSLWEQTELSSLQGEIQYQLSLYQVFYKAGILLDYCEEVLESEK